MEHENSINGGDLKEFTNGGEKSTRKGSEGIY
jgi:hypothetical protein